MTPCKNPIPLRLSPALLACALAACLSGCAAPPRTGYGLQADRQPPPVETGALTAANTRSTYLDLVAQMQGKGLWFASLAHIDALEKQWGAVPETTLLRADALRMTAQPAPAAALYKGLLASPVAASAQRGLGLIAAGEGDFVQAVSRFELAQRLTPTDAALLSDLGYALLKAGRVADARVPIMQASQLQAESPRVQANLALFLLADGQVERAQAVMNGQGVPPALRGAILREARALRPGLALPAAMPGSAGSGASDSADAPLMLKTTAWTMLSDAPK
ncbi:MAG: pilus assembly protein [Comamonadaceae bacterium]|nr:MAG: pilus assembly protein [Comamonadaceae bacterium]